MRAISSISEHPDGRTAALEVIEGLDSALDGASPTAVLLFASFHHSTALPVMAEMLGSQLRPQALIGGTAQSVFTESAELDRRSGFAALALAGEGLTARTFMADWEHGPAELLTPKSWSERISTGPDHAATILFADPFTTDPAPVLQAIDHAVPGPISGGLLSGATRPGCNVLLADRMHANTGVVGLGIGGPIRCETLISRGCRPIGTPMVVTSARSGQVMSLGGRPAAEVARDAILELEDTDRELVSNGLRLGLAMNEYRERFGAQDFLVREIVGVDEETGSLQIAERPSVGQTVQFLIRDPDSARNDLELALDKLSLDDTPPLGVLLCESRIRGNLEEDLTCLRSRMEGVPLAGMVCAGEFDRGTDRSVVHGASASAMIFRTKRR